jgi:hypothetical protein
MYGCVEKAMDKPSHMVEPTGCEINYFNTSYAVRAFGEVTFTDYLEEYFLRIHTEYPDTDRLYTYWSRIGWFYFRKTIFSYAKALPCTIPDYAHIEESYREFTEDICELEYTAVELAGAC